MQIAGTSDEMAGGSDTNGGKLAPPPETPAPQALLAPAPQPAPSPPAVAAPATAPVAATSAPAAAKPAAPAGEACCHVHTGPRRATREGRARAACRRRRPRTPHAANGNGWRSACPTCSLTASQPSARPSAAATHFGACGPAASAMSLRPLHSASACAPRAPAARSPISRF